VEQLDDRIVPSGFTNGDFEGGVQSVAGLPQDSIPAGWQLGPPSPASLSNVSVTNTVDSTLLLHAADGSGNYVRFQSTASNGSKDCLFQDFDTVAQQQYKVTFSVAITNAGVGNNSEIGLNPVWDENGANQATMGANNFYFSPTSAQGPIDYQTFSFIETASSATTRMDFHATDDAGSILLDDVSVVPVTSGGQPPVVTTAASGSVSTSGTTAALSVSASDPQNQALTYTWSVTSAPSGAATPTFSVNGTGSANNTTATFSKAGNYTFLVTITDTGGLSTTSSVSLTVNQVATSLVVSPSSTTLAVNATKQFSATVNDQFGNALATQPSISWQLASGVGSIDTTGKYTAPASAGTATVQASGAGLSGTASVTVSTNAFLPVTDLKATPGSNGSVTLTWTSTGTTEYFIYHIINGQEFGVNAAFGGTSGTVSYVDSGLTNGTTYVYVIKAVYNGSNLSADSNVVSATPGAPTPPTITSQPSNVAVVLGQSASFTSAASGTGPITLVWEKLITTTCIWVPLDSTNAPGFQVTTNGNTSTLSFASVVAADAGSYYLSATNAVGEVDSNAAILTIQNPPVVTTAASGTVGTSGTTAALSVSASDPQNQALTYTWSVTSKPSGASAPTFSDNGTSTANATTATFSKAGNYTFLVTITDTGGLSTTSSVSLTVNQVATSLVVSPSSTTLAVNATKQFSATVNDQFGNALATQPTFAWGASNGSITSGGVYTAPATIPGGAVTITATAAGLSGTASVTVTASFPPVTDLKATPSATGQITLSWTSTGTVEYFVYRIVNGQEFGIDATFGGTSGTVTFKVGGLHSGTTQTYVVKAVYNGSTLSADSNIVSAVVP
jgi:hypothetical protein